MNGHRKPVVGHLPTLRNGFEFAHSIGCGGKRGVELALIGKRGSEHTACRADQVELFRCERPGKFKRFAKMRTGLNRIALGAAQIAPIVQRQHQRPHGYRAFVPGAAQLWHSLFETGV